MNFNSHAHVERDTRTSVSTTKKIDFNSHAHVERDSAICNSVCNDNVISTHTLTWSVTQAIQLHD